MQFGPVYFRPLWLVGAGLLVAGLLLFVTLPASRQARAAVGIVFLMGFGCGLVAEVRSRRRVLAKLSARNYSWCAGCGYPFDQGVDDQETITCAECGATVRAELARNWYRENPVRARQIADL